jgi:hypothetical protein
VHFAVRDSPIDHDYGGLIVIDQTIGRVWFCTWGLGAQGAVMIQRAEKSMQNPTDDQIAGLLIGIISDGFNRSLGALEAAGAIDTTKMRRHYTGIGSKFYDMVTEQI